MPTSVSSYYVEELINWNHAINFYCNEIDELSDKLTSQLKGCTEELKPEVSGRLAALRSMTARFSRLQVEMFTQERLFQPSDGSLLSNNLIMEKDVTSQDVLRLNVQAAEKEFIDLKYCCYQLMAALINKKHLES